VVAQLNSGMYRVFFAARVAPADSELLSWTVRMSKPYVATISSCDLGACDHASNRSCCHLVVSSHSFLADLRTQSRLKSHTKSPFNNNNRFTALSPGLTGWAGTRRNTRPPTILIISPNLYQLLPSTMIHSILHVQITCLAIFLHNLSPRPVWSTSWSGALCLIFHTLLHPVSVFFSQHMPIPATCFAVVSRSYHLLKITIHRQKLYWVIRWRTATCFMTIISGLIASSGFYTPVHDETGGIIKHTHCVAR